METRQGLRFIYNKDLADQSVCQTKTKVNLKCTYVMRFKDIFLQSPGKKKQILLEFVPIILKTANQTAPK